jgi:8-oxo-dGTP pyrophosphatase MutT (NUDIX family)
MNDATHRNGHPVSVKGVVFVDRRVLLLRNERDEWELPGGRPEAGETWPEALARELLEEANIGVDVGALICEWPYEVLPGRFVWIAAFGCRPVSTGAVRISDEHRELRFFDATDLDGLALHHGYRAAIDAWHAIARHAPPFSGSSR